MEQEHLDGTAWKAFTERSKYFEKKSKRPEIEYSYATDDPKDTAHTNKHTHQIDDLVDLTDPNNDNNNNDAYNKSNTISILTQHYFNTIA